MTKRDSGLDSNGRSTNEITEMWRDHRRELQERRGVRRGQRTADIMALQAAGFSVVSLTEYQFRIDGKLDLFPTRSRYHFLPTNRRGHYDTPASIANRFLREHA